MSAAVVPWQPATLPPGWRVLHADMTLERPFPYSDTGPIRAILELELAHITTGVRVHLQLATQGEPAQVNELALANYLLALTPPGGMGASVVRIDAYVVP